MQLLAAQHSGCELIGLVLRKPTDRPEGTAFDFRDAEHSVTVNAEQFGAIPLEEVVRRAPHANRLGKRPEALFAAVIPRRGVYGICQRVQPSQVCLTADGSVLTRIAAGSAALGILPETFGLHRFRPVDCRYSSSRISA